MTIDTFTWLNLIISVRILQRNRSNRIYIDIEKEVDYEELALAIMEAVKTYDLPSPSWKPKKAGDVIPI